MLRFFRQSLLAQLLGGYVLFVVVVMLAGLALSLIVQRQIRAVVYAADIALAKTIALEIAGKMEVARESLAELAVLDAVRDSDRTAMRSAFGLFKKTRPDLDRVYWIDAAGIMQVSVPMDPRTEGTDYAEERFFQQAQTANDTFVEAGSVDLTTFNGVVIVAQPVRDARGRLTGVVATNLLLTDLSAPLRTVVEEQSRQGQPLSISVIDNRGQLIAAPQRERLLQPVLEQLPGAREALAGEQPEPRLEPGPRSQEWLFSAVPIRSLGWAVVVQRPAITALAAENSVEIWLRIGMAMLAIVGLLFWLVLLSRIIQPLHQLAERYRVMSTAESPPPATPPHLTRRIDEVGGLARALQRLEQDVATRLTELRTLLETSNAVVGTLDPGAVARTIIREVRRLVDVVAVAVLVPNDDGTLQVLASEGRSEYYDQTISIHHDDENSPSAQAMRSGQPIQMIAGASEHFPPVAYNEGFRALLAVPIISRHAGGVVVLVSRTQPQPFSANELDLLLTFANYATLAWEHAVLYERSDERLREVARENERLYREAMQVNQFKTTLLAAVGHELRTPLAAIKGHATTLLEDDVVWSPADQRHFLQTISDEADRLAHLVSNLLDLSRREAGLLLLHRSAWQLDDLLTQAIQRLSRDIPRLTLQIPSDLPALSVDRPRMEVVLRNLLSNALAYGEGGIWVSAQPQNGDVIVRITDDGPGIAADDLPHIFERFYRAPRSVQRHSGGSGLGLAICKAFVEAHGGAIWAESNGIGTTIGFSLPLAKSDER